MDGDSKKSLKIAITEFYKLNSSKGKEYTFKNFKNGGVHKATTDGSIRVKIKQKEIARLSIDRLAHWRSSLVHPNLKSELLLGYPRPF